MVAPVISFLYLLLSPLSKDYDVVKEGDDEMLRMYERSHAFFVSHRQVHNAQWEGTVFPGCCANKRVACLTCLLPCCMFGYVPLFPELITYHSSLFRVSCSTLAGLPRPFLSA